MHWKLVTPEEAVKIVKSGDWIDYGFGHTKPIALDAALAARKDELKEINIHSALSLSPHACAEADPEGKVFTIQSWHFGGLDRKLHDRGRCFYHPMVFRNQGLYYRKSITNLVDVAMLRVTAMNHNGFFNFHCGVAAERAVVDVAKHVIVEVDDQLPWAMGGREEVIHLSEVDYIVEQSSPPEIVPSAVASETDRKIARHIVPHIANGACLQLGIGGLPNSVGTLLAESDIEDLGCHTEMLVDAYYELYKAGKLTNKRKKIDRGRSVYAFAMGSKALYDWIDHNPSLAAFPVSYTNDPYVMAQMPTSSPSTRAWRLTSTDRFHRSPRVSVRSAGREASSIMPREPIYRRAAFPSFAAVLLTRTSRATRSRPSFRPSLAAPSSPCLGARHTRS